MLKTKQMNRTGISLNQISENKRKVFKQNIILFQDWNELTESPDNCYTNPTLF